MNLHLREGYRASELAVLTPLSPRRRGVGGENSVTRCPPNCVHEPIMVFSPLPSRERGGGEGVVALRSRYLKAER